MTSATTRLSAEPRRSEERRVGKEGRSRGSPDHLKKNRNDKPIDASGRIIKDNDSHALTEGGKRFGWIYPSVEVLILRQRARVNQIFFFSSRRRHTSCLSDWSSDLCSSD